MSKGSYNLVSLLIMKIRPFLFICHLESLRQCIQTEFRKTISRFVYLDAIRIASSSLTILHSQHVFEDLVKTSLDTN